MLLPIYRQKAILCLKRMKYRSVMPLIIPRLSIVALLLFVLGGFQGNAQEKTTVNGTITGEGSFYLKDVSVILKSTDSVNIYKAKTSVSGVFSIPNVLTNKIYNITLFKPAYQKMELRGYRFHSGKINSMLLTMTKSSDLEEVVVTTALGIKREQRSLGFAESTITGEQLTEAISNNWTDALSGKVAGLNLIRSNAGPSGSNKIILRGDNNLTGDNEALIVVDGVVINQGSGRNTAISGESSYGVSSDNMPADYGSNINDLNPENIASVTILKGPGASALYGQRGANGAIIITTKSGNNKHNGLGVNFYSNSTLSSVNRWPSLQYQYGQGLSGATYYSYGTSADGASTSGTSSAYGPKFDGQYFYQYNPGLQGQDSVRTLWHAYKNQIRKFFNTAQTYTNTISVSGGTDKTTARFSLTDTRNKWIIPNTGYRYNSVSLNVNSRTSDKLQVNASINYNHKWSDNLPGSGYGNQSIMYWFIFWQPNADLNWLKDYWTKGKSGKSINYPFSSYPSNPYAVSYQYLNSSNRNAITGNVQAIYTITPELSFNVRTSVDMSYESREQKRPYDAGSLYPKGSYRTQNIFSIEESSDFLLTYNKNITKDFQIRTSLGGSILSNRYNKDESRADSLTYPEIYSLSNAAGQLVTLPYKSKYNINSLYGIVDLSYRNLLFLDLSGREDWNSVLATPSRTTNSGFFYPAASVSFILSDAVKLPDIINFAKLRFSLSGVGSGGTTPYLTSYSYATAGSIYSGALQVPSTLTNSNLKPLRTTTYEIGTNVEMLHNRITLDLALYTGTTKDQILSRTLDRSSGYTYAVINAGSVNNKGIEISLNAIPIRTNKFSWNTSITFSVNRNKIISLPDSSIILFTGALASSQMVAKVGGSMGDLYGRGYLRAPNGQVIYDPKTGVPELTDGVKYLGNSMPKGKIGWLNEFKYGRFGLHLLFDAQYGAVAYSLMSYKLSEQGKLTKTLPGRYNGIIGNGVVDNGDGTYSKNMTIATDIDEYYRAHYGANNAEGSTFKTDFIKFREARIDFNLPTSILKIAKLRQAAIGIYGRDLFTWSPWPMFDPEFGTISGTDIVRGFEYAQFPSTRSYGFNLILGF